MPRRRHRENTPSLRFPGLYSVVEGCTGRVLPQGPRRRSCRFGPSHTRDQAAPKAQCRQMLRTSEGSHLEIRNPPAPCPAWDVCERPPHFNPKLGTRSPEFSSSTLALSSAWYPQAFHSDEVKNAALGLRPDLEWYLATQLHPPVTRLCEHIQGMDSHYIAEILGLQSSKYIVHTTTGGPSEPVAAYRCPYLLSCAALIPGASQFRPSLPLTLQFIFPHTSMIVIPWLEPPPPPHRTFGTDLVCAAVQQGKTLN